MEIKDNHHRGEEFERYLSSYQNDPTRSRHEGRELAILAALQIAVRKGFIDFSKITSAFDFGAGYGGPTMALKYFLHSDAILEAAEPNPAKAAEIVHFGIVPRDRIYKDGFRYLADQRGQGCSIDLITAFMFGPEGEEITFEKFIKKAAAVISSDGQIILTTDGYTFRSVMNQCRDNGIEFEVNPGACTTCTMSSIPSTLHIQGAALATLRFPYDKST